MVTVRRPQRTASSSVANQRSIVFPITAPPVSAAIASPYPGTVIRVPSGLTVGSTATTPGHVGFQDAVRPRRMYQVWDDDSVMSVRHASPMTASGVTVAVVLCSIEND